MWRAVVTQPFDRTCRIPQIGDVDAESGEFWVENVFQMPGLGHNLSAFEQNRVFLNEKGRQFVDVSYASTANLDSDSRSVIVADFDRDDRPDVLIASVGGGPLRLFLNRFPNGGNRIRLELIGEESNRSGIGSRVTLECGDQRIVRDHFAANGFMGQSLPELLIGVGKTESIDRLTIRWPSGKSQSFEELPIDCSISVREGSDALHIAPFEAAVSGGAG